jgi:hypothetical protein
MQRILILLIVLLCALAVCSTCARLRAKELTPKELEIKRLVHENDSLKFLISRYQADFDQLDAAREDFARRRARKKDVK